MVNKSNHLQSYRIQDILDQQLLVKYRQAGLPYHSSVINHFFSKFS